MKKKIFFIALIFCNIVVFGQDMTDIYKGEIEKYLNKNDCDNAQVAYDAYKKSRNGITDADIEARINACKERSKTIAEYQEWQTRIRNFESQTPKIDGVFNVFFFKKETTVSTDQSAKVAQAAGYLNSNPSAKLRVTGYNSESMSISETRAKAVSQILIAKYGINSNRLTIEWKGGGPYTNPDANEVVTIMAYKEQAVQETQNDNMLQSFKTLQEFIQSAMNSNPTANLGNGKYKGQMSDGNRNGLGAYYWNDDKSFYFGGFIRGNQNGSSIEIAGNLDNSEVNNCPNCKFYVGSWSNGLKSGKGTCYDKTGKLIYYGDFKDDKPIETYPTTGSYTSYKFQIISYGNQGVYAGETKDGKKYGQGIFLWLDKWSGDMWYGRWADDLRDGYGIYIRKDGTMFTGTWKGDTYNP